MIVLAGNLDGFRVLSTGELLVRDVQAGYEGYEFACISRNILSNATLTSSPAMLFVDGKENIHQTFS